MKVIGHRGAASLAPENTFAGFDMALAMGVDGIETDVQRTKDGKLVLFHDDLLTLCKIKEKSPLARVGYVTGDFSEENLARVVEAKIENFCPRAEKITKHLVNRWHSLGLFVRACGVKNTEMMKNAIHTGVDG